MSHHPPRILVIGAINQDETARIEHHPTPGETVVTAEIEIGTGGKGANQAAAAATSGFEVDVQMLGAVGDDAAGDLQVEALAAVGVDTSLVRRVLGTPTGRAFITVDAQGENSIVVGLGANAFVSLVNINGASVPAVAIAQTEIGAAAVEGLSRFASTVRCRFILNNGPALSLPPHVLQPADPLVVNEIEAREMLGPIGHTGELDGTRIARSVRERFSVTSVVVTLGASGCAVADADGERLIPAPRVAEVVDTTGAGDVFIGVLAAALASGRTLDTAVRDATIAAGEAVQWRGARRPRANTVGSLTSVR